MWGKRRIRMTPGFWHEVFLREKREAGLHRAGEARAPFRTYEF